MTNDGKLAWLNTMNAHLSAGGKLKHLGQPTDKAPSWYSATCDWEIVPLPRKSVIRVAYRWREFELPQCMFIGDTCPIGDDWKIKEIEVSDE
jgi:hypothetical protein